MAVREPFMQKFISGTGTLELQADDGEGLMIYDVQIANPNSNYATFRIDRSTVGYWRIGGTLGSHLALPIGRSQHSHDWLTSATAAGDQTSFAGLKNAGGTEVVSKMIGGLSASTTYRRVGALSTAPYGAKQTILSCLRSLGLFKGYPVPEGKKFVVSFTQQASTRVIITYAIHDAGDIRGDLQDGPLAKVNLYLNYGNAGASINASGDTVLTVSANPAEFFAFPFGAHVPASASIEVLGVFASDFAPKENDGTNDCTTVALKFTKERVVLFDPDRVGFRLEAPTGANTGNMDLVAEGNSVIGNYSDVDYREPLIFPTPIACPPGTELLLHLNTLKAGTGQNIAIDEHEVGVLLRLTKGGM